MAAEADARPARLLRADNVEGRRRKSDFDRHPVLKGKLICEDKPAPLSLNVAARKPGQARRSRCPSPQRAFPLALEIKVLRRERCDFAGISVPSNRGRMAMPKEKNLDDLFHETLKDIYFAEKKILTALPKMAKAAQSDELTSAFEKHASETQEHVDRLEQVFSMIGKTPRGKTCPAVLGLIEEGREIMEDFKDTEALDAGLLAGAQAVEHYEISRYGTLIAWAKQMGLSDAAELLGQTLAEEKTTDESLTSIAETAVNYEAAAE